MNLIKENLSVLLADDDSEEHAKFIAAINAVSPTTKIESAYHGMELLDHLQKSGTKSKPMPDVIITDLYMPFAGGLQVLKQMKLHPDFKQIPICVFSKNHDITIKTKVLENGAAEFHRKPSDLGELKDLISHILIKISQASYAS